MLRLVSLIEIEQKTEYKGFLRDKKYSFNFVNEVEITSTWANQTDTAKIVFPKKVYFYNEFTKKNETWSDKNIIGGDSTPPLIMRGDKVKITLGYRYFRKIDRIYTDNAEPDQTTEFEGYVTKVNPRVPIEIECEDSMWLLKQIQAPNKTWLSSKYNLESMITEMLKGSSVTFKVRNSVGTKIGNFITHNETVSQVLDRLRKDAYLNSYIRNGELRCSGLVYYPEDQRDVYKGAERVRDWVFDFQKNIIDDDLVYTRKDDINIQVRAISKLEIEQGSQNSAGRPKKSISQIEVLIPEKTKGDAEKRTLHFYNLTKDELIERATQELDKLYYEGFKGSFTTFGIPSARHGDRITIVDKKLTERAGTYLCKGVTKTFGQNGFRQKIELDLRIDGIN